MKKLVKITSILGATVLGFTTIGTGVVSAADITADNNTTTAKVGLETDPSAKIELLKAPNFDFGSTQIGANALDLQAATVDDPITVSNPGLATGWNVTVAGTAFQNADATQQLKGAELTLNGVVSPGDGTLSDNPATTGQITINDQAQSIFTAAANHGIGTWLNTYSAQDDSAKLAIPGGNQAGSYTSTLTWTLADAPN